MKQDVINKEWKILRDDYLLDFGRKFNIKFYHRYSKGRANKQYSQNLGIIIPYSKQYEIHFEIYQGYKDIGEESQLSIKHKKTGSLKESYAFEGIGYLLMKLFKQILIKSKEKHGGKFDGNWTKVDKQA